MPTESRFAITQTIKGKLPRLPFKRMKNDIVGKHYTLSTAFVGDTRAATLNRTYRGKHTPANVLSFSLSKNEGEIIINPHQAKRDAKQFNMSKKQFVGYLFIHGLLHLKEYAHGSKMNREEERLLKKFDIV